MDKLTKDYLRAQEKLREDLSIATNTSHTYGRAQNLDNDWLDNSKEEKALTFGNLLTVRIIKIVLMMVVSILGFGITGSVFLTYFDSQFADILFIIWWVIIVWKA